jgi:hypothetical protein
MKDDINAASVHGRLANADMSLYKINLLNINVEVAS